MLIIRRPHEKESYLMPDSPLDIDKAHRYFAVELNNRAWDLVEAPSRTDDETDEMLHAAHGAAWHWSKVGEPIHQLRAMVLLAAAHAKAGLGEAAIRFADRGLALSERVGDAQSAFDRATVHGAAALAWRTAGRGAEAERHAANRHAATAALADDQERKLIEQLFGVE
jgi:hypothetical protein